MAALEIANETTADVFAGRPPRVVVYSDDTSLIDAISRVVDGGKGVFVRVLPKTDPIMAASKADLAILDVTGLAEPAGRIAEAARAVGRPLMVVGDVNDVRNYRAAVKAGARDYVVPPLDEAEFAASLAAMMEAPAAETKPAGCRMNLVVGVRGGVGATTLAVSTAWLAAEQFGKTTALVDLDLQYGACALALDLLPGNGLRDALENPQRIDALFVASGMLNATDRLSVLSGEDALDRMAQPAPGAANALMDAIVPGFEVAVLDVPRAMCGAEPELMQRADSVTLVSDLSIPGLRDTTRLQTLMRQEFGLTTVQVAVVHRAKQAAHLTEKEFEQGIGGAVDYWLPFEPKSVAAAAAQGKPVPELAGARHALTKACAAMAGDFCGATEQKTRRKLWRW